MALPHDHIPTCCSSQSRQAEDEWLASHIPSFVPQLRWISDHLPSDTGCQKLNFTSLRLVFLYLPLDLDTLLAVASTCSKWRILIDGLSHWSLLLPMRNEVLPAMLLLRWQERPRFRRITCDKDGNYISPHGNITAPPLQIATATSAIDILPDTEPLSVTTTTETAAAPAAVAAARNSSDDDDDEQDNEAGAAAAASSAAATAANSATQQQQQHVSRRQRRRLARQQRRQHQQQQHAAAAAVVSPTPPPNSHKCDRTVHLRWIDTHDPANRDIVNQLPPLAVSVPRGVFDLRPAAEVFDESNYKPCCGCVEYDYEFRVETQEYESIDNARLAAFKEAYGSPASLEQLFRDPHDDELLALYPPQVKTQQCATGELEETGRTDSVDWHNLLRARNSNDDDEDGITRNATAAAPPATTTTTAIVGSTTTFQDPAPAQLVARTAAANPVTILAPSLQSVSGVPVRGALISRTATFANTCRLRRQTILRHLSLVNGNLAGYQQKWMFPSLSSYTNHVRALLHCANGAFVNSNSKQGSSSSSALHTRIWNRYGEFAGAFLVCAVMIVLSIIFGWKMGNKEVYERFQPIEQYPTDERVGTTVGIIMFFAVLFVVIAYCVAYLWVRVAQGEEPKRPILASRLIVVVGIFACLSFMAEPLALLRVRVTSAQMLLDSGSVSVCDAWSNITTTTVAGLAGKTITKAADLVVDGQALQCRIPESLRPSRLAAATFLELPPGTRLLYHPPSVGQRTVPFTASRSSTDSDTCTISQQNSVVSNVDAAANMTRTDVDRGYIGYYTVFLPSSCNGAAAVKNATLLIMGSSPRCPFWSRDENNHTADESLIHGYFQSGELINNTEADAVGNGTEISSALGAALANLTTSDSLQPACMQARNALVTVRNLTEYNKTAHRFYLRVASGFNPHWTASYYHCRQPCEDKPWATRAKWTDTLDWQLNGIVALMADLTMFTARMNTASENPRIYPPFDGDDWSDDGESVFLTGAHPAGLRRIRNAYEVGAVNLVISVAVIASAALLIGFASQAIVRVFFVIVGALIVGIFIVPVPLLLLMSSCYDKSVAMPTQAAELLLPAFCLGAGESDFTPAYFFALSVTTLVVLIAFVVPVWERRDECRNCVVSMCDDCRQNAAECCSCCD